MIFLYIIFCLILFIIDKGRNKLFLFFSCITMLILIEGLRWGSGVDFYHYKNMYVNGHPKEQGETLYWCLFDLFSKQKIPFTLFLLFIAVIQYLFYFVGILRQSKVYIITIIFLFASNLGFMGNSRQMLAVAIYFFAVPFLYEKKYIQFILYLLIAGLIHQTVFFTLPILFLNRKIKLKYLVWVGVIIFFGSLFGLFQYLMYFLADNFYVSLRWFKKLLFYLSEHKRMEINWLQFLYGVLRRIFPIFILFNWRDKLQYEKGYYLLCNISFLNLFIYTIGFFGLPLVLGRFTIYFTVFEGVIYSWLLCVFWNSRFKNIIIISLVLFAFIIMLRSISPYTNLFIPYRTIFGTL